MHALLPALVILLAAPATSLAGGDEQHVPPSAGPPGPWDGPSGRSVPYEPSQTKRCAPAAARHAGAGSVLGIFVHRATCHEGRRIVRAYQSCLERERGRVGDCYGSISRRCVQPEFLGRCRTYDRFFRRTRTDPSGLSVRPIPGLMPDVV